MGRLEDLRLSYSKMSPKQQLQRIREIRAERKINRNPRKEKKARADKKSDAQKLAKQLAKLSPEQLRSLLG